MRMPIQVTLNYTNDTEFFRNNIICSTESLDKLCKNSKNIYVNYARSTYW